MSFFVVALHGEFLIDINYELSYYFVNGLCRIAVPIFLITTGYYFFYVNTLNDFYRWIEKLIILYLIWMIIYIPDWDDYNIKVIAQKIFLGHKQLWYLISSIYGLFILRLVQKNIKILIALCVSALLFGLILQYNYCYNKILFNIPFGCVSFRNALTFSFPYLSIGYLINAKKDTCIHKISDIKMYCILCVGVFSLILESYINYIFSGGGRSFDLLISASVVSPILFICVLRHPILSNIKFLSVCYSGIYFTHMYVLDFLGKRMHSATLLVIVVFFVCVCMSLTYYFIIEFIKYCILKKNE